LRINFKSRETNLASESLSGLGFQHFQKCSTGQY
jgi:hypothetical protein